jgi:hypothetical protein
MQKWENIGERVQSWLISLYHEREKIILAEEKESVYTPYITVYDSSEKTTTTFAPQSNNKYPCNKL